MCSITRFRRLPRSSQASVILRAACFTICLTIGVWLVLWLLLVRSTVDLVAAMPDVLPDSLHSVAALLPPAIDKDEGIWTPLDGFSLGFDLSAQERLRRSLDKASGRPIILYLAAPVAGVDNASGPAKGVFTADAIGRLIDLCQSRHGKSKLLLIIDPGRVGPDPKLGARNSDIARYLKARGTPPEDAEETFAWKEKWRNFGILCACSPEQSSWPLESEHRTIFDQVLRRAQTKPRKLRPMIKLISYAVSRCVREYFSDREYISEVAQNPMYLGDPGLDFFVPAAKPRMVSDRSRTRTNSTWENLRKEYKRRDDLEKRRPYAYAPFIWREYQEHLLRAERLFRAGRWNDASRELDRAQKVAADLTLTSSVSVASLAMGIRYTEEPKVYISLEEKLGAAFSGLASKNAAGPTPEPAPAEKAALPAEKKGATPVAVPGSPVRQSGSAVGKIMRVMKDAPPDEQVHWKHCIEGQLIEWMRAYQQLAQFADNENLLSEDRMEIFKQAIELRLRAERAAAIALDGPSPLRLAIEEGDRHLRVAQDLLFVDQATARVRSNSELKDAEEQYRRAKVLADGIELVGKVKSTLPFLGVWYVRHSARYPQRLGEEPDELIARIGDETRELDGDLRSDKAGHDPSPRSFFDVEELIKKLQRRYGVLERAFGAVLERSERPSDWRLVDDLLLVPAIVSSRREQLVACASKLPLTSGGQSGDGELRTSEPGAPGATSKDAGGPMQADVKGELVKTAVYRNWDRAFFDWVSRALAPGSTPAAAEDDEPREIYSEPTKTEEDKTYVRIAGGATKLAEALESVDGLNSPRRRAGLAERLHELNQWMGERLLNDADLVRAERSLALGATPGGSTAEVRAELAALRREPWLFARRSDSNARLGLNGLALKIEVRAQPEIPQGIACLWISGSDGRDLPSVELSHQDLPIEGGIEVPLPQRGDEIGVSAHRVFQEVPAREPTKQQYAGDRSVMLSSTLFYRGRAFHGTLGVLNLEPIQNQFLIRLKTNEDKIKEEHRGTVPRNQFTNVDDPIAGYVYPGCRHPCVLTITYKASDRKPVQVEVEWGLGDGRDLKVKELTLADGTPEQFAEHEIYFGLAGEKAQAVDKPFLREQKLVVKVWPKGASHKGHPVTQRTFMLREINPEKFNSVYRDSIAAGDEHPSGVLTLTVLRSRDDPVVVPIGVLAVAPDGFERIDRPNMKDVPLERGKKYTFQFTKKVKSSKPKTYDFFIVFAGDYSMKYPVTIEGTGAPGAEAPAPPQ
jgi:hypothetical protein